MTPSPPCPLPPLHLPPPHIFPPPSSLPSFPQHFPPLPYPNAQAVPPFANPNLLPTPQYLFPCHPTPIQQPIHWPSQFGQYIPQYTPVQPPLPLNILNPKPSSMQPSPKAQAKTSQISRGTVGTSASFHIDTKAFLLAFDRSRMDS